MTYIFIPVSTHSLFLSLAESGELIWGVAGKVSSPVGRLRSHQVNNSTISFPLLPKYLTTLQQLLFFCATVQPSIKVTTLFLSYSPDRNLHAWPFSQTGFIIFLPLLIHVQNCPSISLPMNIQSLHSSKKQLLFIKNMYCICM